MELVILVVGRLRPAMREAADDYLRRLRRYIGTREVEVREASREPTIPAQRDAEAARLAERMPAGSRLVALAREGQGWTSAELARRIDEWRLAARPVTFVLGGPHGLAPALLQQAELRWSLGALTLPHELARVVVLEQLYRAFTILRGEPYHKGS
ncbi:MAG TPA: 23S rRNA (pseudouridine(1915)-N(3))-methyltransferase RlmH [Gemmatimonadales bacterium]|nr:23S rRNA (pseudouridine(1915)-N(3))-methyltransferase RlmH [Gemmatimonadales bacterium]